MFFGKVKMRHKCPAGFKRFGKVKRPARCNDANSRNATCNARRPAMWVHIPPHVPRTSSGGYSVPVATWQPYAHAGVSGGPQGFT